MFNNNEFKTIDVEGPDQVGKGDAVRNMALEFGEKGIDTTIVTLPYYSTPVGYAIRETLTQGFSYDLDISREREVEVKMALFALNRLEILNCILSNQREGVYVFDRGPFSNALTIAYEVVNNKEGQDIEELAEIAMGLDRYFRKVLNIDNCVIKLKANNTRWVQSRVEKGDLHEQRDVQEQCENIYEIFEKLIGSGWKKVVTRDEKGWRDREDINKECMEFASRRLGIYGGRFRKKRTPKYLSIQDIQDSMYQGSKIDSKIKLGWEEALLDNDKERIYQNSKEIANSLVSSSKRIKWYNREIVLQVILMINEYPELLSILEKTYNQEFVLKFLNSLYE